jgi:type III pantothenate kinase
MVIFAAMNLVIDLGNTSAKLTLFKDKELVEVLSSNSDVTLKWIHEVVKTIKNIDSCILCSVVDHPIEVEDYLEQTFKMMKFDQQTKVPIENDYETIETLGLDRLAAAIGANSIFPNHNILVIDFGTCIKYDIVTNNTYNGGGIAPGMRMRFNALNKFTDKLPLVEPSDSLVVTGKTTTESILSGVQFGIASEVTGIIEYYHEQFNNLKVVFSGGDAHFFENVLKKDIFAAPNLVSRGLNEVLLYNASSK